MKSGYVTFFLIAVMTAGLVFLLVTRERSKHDAPAEVIVVATTPDAGADAGVASDAGAVTDAGIADAGGPKSEAPLRVATLGWELAAPAAVVKSPAIEIAPESTPEAIKERLARGGADPNGADIAIEPLADFVTSYDGLRALDLRAFLVVGYSVGREEMHAAPGALTKAPPGGDEVKLVAADASRPAAVFGLFTLDLLGAAPARIRLVASGTPEAKAASFAAVTKGAGDERKLAMSTADASRFAPFVAIAPKGVLDAREGTIRDWSRAWLEGFAQAKADVPGIARRLAAKENLPLAAGVGGAPEALALVERLGSLESVPANAAGAAFSARSVVTLEALMARTWQLARGGGLVTSPAPEPLPVDGRIAAKLEAPKETLPAAAPGDAGAFGPIPAGSVPLTTYRAVDVEADKVVTQLVFLSGVFPRASFRISAKGGAKAATAIAAAATEKGIAPTRLATTTAEPPGAFAAVELLAPP